MTPAELRDSILSTSDLHIIGDFGEDCAQIFCGVTPTHRTHIDDGTIIDTGEVAEIKTCKVLLPVAEGLSLLDRKTPFTMCTAKARISSARIKPSCCDVLILVCLYEDKVAFVKIPSNLLVSEGLVQPGKPEKGIINHHLSLSGAKLSFVLHEYLDFTVTYEEILAKGYEDLVALRKTKVDKKTRRDKKSATVSSPQVEQAKTAETDTQPAVDEPRLISGAEECPNSIIHATNSSISLASTLSKIATWLWGKIHHRMLSQERHWRSPTIQSMLNASMIMPPSTGLCSPPHSSPTEEQNEGCPSPASSITLETVEKAS